MRKRFLVEFSDKDGVTADDLRLSILDAWGFPIAIEEDPELLQVTELTDAPPQSLTAGQMFAGAAKLK